MKSIKFEAETDIELYLLARKYVMEFKLLNKYPQDILRSEIKKEFKKCNPLNKRIVAKKSTGLFITKGQEYLILDYWIGFNSKDMFSPKISVECNGKQRLMFCKNFFNIEYSDRLNELIELQKFIWR